MVAINPWPEREDVPSAAKVGATTSLPLQAARVHEKLQEMLLNMSHHMTAVFLMVEQYEKDLGTWTSEQNLGLHGALSGMRIEALQLYWTLALLQNGQISQDLLNGLYMEDCRQLNEIYTSCGIAWEVKGGPNSS